MKTSHPRRVWFNGTVTAIALSVSLLGIQPRLAAQVPPALPREANGHEVFEEGLRQLKNRNYPRAIAAFNQAIQIDPKFKEAYSARGFAYLQSGQLQQAINSYTQILQIDPSAASAHAGLALVRARLGDYQQSQAETALSAALLAKQTTRHLYQGELSLLELAEATGGRTPESNLWKLVEQGNQQLNAKNYRGAVATFSQAAKLAPSGSARPYIDRGVAYFWLRDYRAAIADFSTAIQANPYYIKAYEYRARAYQQIGQSQAAQADMRKAIELAQRFGSPSLYQELVGKLQQARQ